MPNTKPKPSNNKSIIIVVAVFAAVAMLASYITALSKFGGSSDTLSVTNDSYVEESVSEVVQESSEFESEVEEFAYFATLRMENFPYRNEAVANGALAVISPESGRRPVVDNDKIVNISKNKTPDVYGLSNTSLVVYDEAMNNFDKFIVSFYENVPKNGLIINKGYSAYETLSSSEATIDLATGYSVQFSIYNSNYRFSSDEFAYLKEQAFRYGIIQRYPDDKELYTGRSSDSTVYRYVGLAHSVYMNHYRFSLEEYLDKIRTEKIIEYVSELEKDTVYVIYYVPVDAALETTYVPLPVNENCSYTVSGDGANGFIVTVRISE